jgi:hypothetical protein
MMKGLIATSVLGLTAANNLHNNAFGRCMDIKLHCLDGTDTAGCQRETTIEKGDNVQLWDCHGKKSQNFELVDGRLRNQGSGLCLDIKAMCLDGTDTPGCDRQSVSDLKVDANIQLWTCRSDDEAGQSSDSYGNQKWVFSSDGTVKNVGSGLCLTAGGGKTETSGRNLHVHTCVASPGQIFEFKDPALEAGTTAAPSALAPGPLATQALAIQAPVVTVSVPTGSMPLVLDGYSEVQFVHTGWIIGAIGAVGAAVALFMTKKWRDSTEYVDGLESLATSE